MKVPEAGMYKTALQNLKAAQTLISNPKRWVQEELAVDCEGNSVGDIRSKQSVAFCALGAVRFVNGPGERKATRLLVRAAKQIAKECDLDIDRNEDGNDYIFTVNDSDSRRTARKRVMEMFKRAIKFAKAK